MGRIGSDPMAESPCFSLRAGPQSATQVVHEMLHGGALASRFLDAGLFREAKAMGLGSEVASVALMVTGLAMLVAAFFQPFHGWVDRYPGRATAAILVIPPAIAWALL